MTVPLKIDFVSDVSCPWCVIGLKGLEDLPAADELRRIPIEKPEALLTSDPGLATTAPQELKLEEAAEKPAESAPPEEAAK